MHNFKKALDVLNWAGWVCGECSREPGDSLNDCPDCKKFITSSVKRLDSKGLLKPDLPEPNIGEITGIPRWGVASWVVSHTINNGTATPYVWIYNEPRMSKPYVFTPGEARELAYAILAAANYAEKLEEDDALSN